MANNVKNIHSFFNLDPRKGSYLESFCRGVLDGQHSGTRVVVTITLAVSILTRIIFIARSFKTIQRIKRRDYNITGEFDTYCIISVWIVRAVQLSIFAYCLNSVSFAWLLWTNNE